MCLLVVYDNEKCHPVNICIPSSYRTNLCLSTDRLSSEGNVKSVPPIIDTPLFFMECPLMFEITHSNGKHSIIISMTL